MAEQKATPKAAELLRHFDAETAAEMGRLIADGSLTPAHIQEIIRLSAALPQFRTPEGLDSLLEDAQEMDAAAFREWARQFMREARG